MHGTADACCTPFCLNIVSSVTALHYQAHAVTIFRVGMLIILDQIPLRYNPQDNDLYTESLHIEPMTTPMVPQINTNSETAIMSSKHIVVFRDLRQLVSAEGGVCDVSHTDFIIKN